MSTSLTILAGPTAIERIKAEGFLPSLFSAVVGASGGAKLLGLTHLDRYIFGEFLTSTAHPVELIGSSIGTWRHVAAAAPDPAAALTTLQERYLTQTWDEHDPRSTMEIVDELCEWVIDGFCSSETLTHVCSHPRYRTHIVTARGRGLNARSAGVGLAAGMLCSAAMNLASRQMLAYGFQRVVFSTGPSRTFEFQDFSTTHAALTPDTVKPALLASGSIPFLMSGQRNIPGAPDGQYWDGGIIDYHFDFENLAGDGLVLYPHFTDTIIKGWFDKPLKWRRTHAALLDRVVLLAPSRDYVSRLPYGKIPDRKDFKRISGPERLAYWREAMASSQALADAFEAVVSSPDPTRALTPFDK